MKKYISISEFETECLTPQANPLVVINNTFSLIYSNDAFKARFNYDAGNCLLDLFAGGDSINLLYNFVKSPYNSFSFDVSFTDSIASNSFYSVSIERIYIKEEEYFLIIFISTGEKYLIESKINNFHKAIEYGGIPIAITDDIGRITYISKPFEELLGVSIDQIFRENITTVMQNYLSVNEREELSSYLRMEKNWIKTISVQADTFYEIQIKPVKDITFNKTYFIVIANDITNHIKYQEQLRDAYKKENHLNRLKSVFLENMSHEIRTPLNAVIGYSEFINESISTSNYEDIKDFTEALKEVLKRIMNLFNNIVEISQIESGEVMFEKDKINLSSVLKGVINKKQQDFEAKNLVVIQNGCNVEVTICSDWFKIEKILVELFDNAIKYTDKGEIIITLEKTINTVIITVLDTGNGIAEDEISRLLQPFEQGETGYTRTNQGAGLGLSIAYKLTKLLGGNFYIKSILNSGTRIQLEFPLDE